MWNQSEDVNSCFNTNVHGLSYLAEPQNILQLCFWRAGAVLRHSPLPSQCHLSGLMPWSCTDKKYFHTAGLTRVTAVLHTCLYHTCPPARNPSAQPPTCLQQGAGLHVVWLSPSRPGPVWCGNPVTPASPVCPPGQQGFGQTVRISGVLLRNVKDSSLPMSPAVTPNYMALFENTHVLCSVPDMRPGIVEVLPGEADPPVPVPRLETLAPINTNTQTMTGRPTFWFRYYISRLKISDKWLRCLPWSCVVQSSANVVHSWSVSARSGVFCGSSPGPWPSVRRSSAG